MRVRARHAATAAAYAPRRAFALPFIQHRRRPHGRPRHRARGVAPSGCCPHPCGARAVNGGARSGLRWCALGPPGPVTAKRGGPGAPCFSPVACLLSRQTKSAALDSMRRATGTSFVSAKESKLSRARTRDAPGHARFFPAPAVAKKQATAHPRRFTFAPSGRPLNPRWPRACSREKRTRAAI